MREHAVVIGSSMGGMVAARVLSKTHRRVTVLDRDTLVDDSRPRKGVPQGRHVHGLQPGGARILEELFPGLLADLADTGVSRLDNLAQADYGVGGRMLFGGDHALSAPMYLSSRPHLESRVRARLRTVPNVEIRSQCQVSGLTTTGTPGRTTVTGVRVNPLDGDRAEERLDADLVVDSSGRGGRTTAWLTELGYQAPDEDKVVVDIKYVSQRLRLPHGALGDKRIVLIAAESGRASVLVLVAQEGGWWQFTIGGYGPLKPPTDQDAVLTFTREIAPPEVFAAIRDAERLTEPVAHRFPASLRRRYERLTRFPERLVVFGDAVCSFNPLYGQGMSVAAFQGMALRECLRNGDDGLARRFFRAATKPIDSAWQLAVAGDLALPEVPGEPPLAMRVANSYLERLFTAAERDPVLSDRFLRVAGMVDQPTALFRPSTLGRVLAGGRRAATGGRAAQPVWPRH